MAKYYNFTFYIEYRYPRKDNALRRFIGSKNLFLYVAMEVGMVIWLFTIFKRPVFNHHIGYYVLRRWDLVDDKPGW